MANCNNPHFSDLSKISINNDHSARMENVPLENLTNPKNGSNLPDIENDKIREALNRQTLIQYRDYAMEKYPKEFIKQEELIAELQSQHFKNYWTNVHLEMIRHQNEQIEKRKAILMEENAETQDVTTIVPDLVRQVIAPANLWTRKNITEFKSDILVNHRSNCIKIPSLSTATIRVPTHKDGRSLFWEFATDYYDIGFGLLFEWNLDQSDNVVVTISESSDDECGDNDQTNPNQERPTNRSGPEMNRDETGEHTQSTSKLNVDELITTYRRECHMEVYCGSHDHSGIGYYILKFDNSYSVWRSKWLYYNVYQTK